MMGDDQEPGVGAPRHLVQKIAKARDVGVVQRRVDLIEHADRRGVGQKHPEDQRQRRQRLLAPRQKRQRRQFLARRLAHDLQPRLQGIVAFHQHQIGLAAAKQVGEQQAEVFVHLLERGQQPLTPFAVQPGDPGPQLLDRLFQIGLFADQSVMLVLHLAGILLGAQVHRPQGIALPLQPVHLGVQRLGPRHGVGIGLQALQQCPGLKRGLLADPLRRSGHRLARRIGPRLGPRPRLARL